MHPRFMRSVLSLGLLWVLLLSFVMGCSERNEDASEFFAGEAQSVEQRQVQNMPPARDSVSQLELEAFDDDLYISGDYLYLDEYNDEDGRALAIEKETLTPSHVIGRGEGQGPGEVQIAGLSVGSGKVVFYSPRQHKYAVYDTSGTFITDLQMNEVPPSEVIPLEDRLVVMSHVAPVEKEGRTPFFFVVDMNGNIVDQFGLSGRPNLARSNNPQAYVGWMVVDSTGTHLYFGSYPEPLLKKYEIGGEQVFSVKTIDDLPSEVNYVSRVGGGRQMWSYTDHALFSTEVLALFRDRLLVVPINDVEGRRLRYIDVYSAEDGSYIESYRTPNPVTGLAIDESSIYTRERIGEGRSFIKTYENVLRGK